jgi:hypothetical protein
MSDRNIQATVPDIVPHQDGSSLNVEWFNDRRSASKVEGSVHYASEENTEERECDSWTIHEKINHDGSHDTINKTHKTYRGPSWD